MCYYSHCTEGGQDVSTVTQPARGKKGCKGRLFTPGWGPEIDSLQNPNQFLSESLGRFCSEQREPFQYFLSRAVLQRQGRAWHPSGWALEFSWRGESQATLLSAVLPHRYTGWEDEEWSHVPLYGPAHFSSHHVASSLTANGDWLSLWCTRATEVSEVNSST